MQKMISSKKQMYLLLKRSIIIEFTFPNQSRQSKLV